MNPRRPVIVAIGGKMGSGKNFVATFLQDYLRREGVTAMVLAFADGVKSAVLRQHRSIGYEQVYGRKTTASRRALQQVGTEYRERFGSDVWFRDVMVSVRRHFESDNATVFIIADLRFTDEAKLLAAAGVPMLLLDAPQRNQQRLRDEYADPVARAELAAHPSEMQCEAPEFRALMTLVVDNDTTLSADTAGAIVAALGLTAEDVAKLRQ